MDQRRNSREPWNWSGSVCSHPQGDRTICNAAHRKTHFLERGGRQFVEHRLALSRNEGFVLKRLHEEPQAKSSDAGDKPFESEYAASCKGILGVACTGDGKREMSKTLCRKTTMVNVPVDKNRSLDWPSVPNKVTESHCEDPPAHSLLWICMNRSVSICFH